MRALLRQRWCSGYVLDIVVGHCIAKILEVGQITPLELLQNRTVEQTVGVPAPRSVNIPVPQNMAEVVNTGVDVSTLVSFRGDHAASDPEFRAPMCRLKGSFSRFCSGQLALLELKGRLAPICRATTNT